MNEEKIKNIIDDTINNLKELSKLLDRVSTIMYKHLSLSNSKDIQTLNNKINIIKDFKQFTLTMQPQIFSTNTMHIIVKKVNNLLKTIPILVKIATNNKLDSLANMMAPLPQLSTYALKNMKDMAEISKNHLEIFTKIINNNNNNINENNEYNEILDEGETSFLTHAKDAICDLWGSIPFIHSDEQRMANSIMAANRDAARKMFSNNIDNLTMGDGSGLLNDLATNGFTGGGFGSGFSSAISSGGGGSWARNFFSSLKNAITNTFDNILGIFGGSINKFEKGVSDFSSSFGGLWNQFTKISNNGQGASLQSIGNFFTSPQFASALGGLAVMYGLWKLVSYCFNKIRIWWEHKQDKKYAIRDARRRKAQSRRRKDVNDAVADAGYNNDRDW